MNIGGVEVGAGQPCRFVAEISNNHNGDKQRAFRLISAAKTAGADFVKFQCYTTSELVQLRGDGPAPEPWGSQGWTMKTLYQKAQTPLDWFPALFQYARDVGIVPFSSVFGLESLLVLERCACPVYKIARLDADDPTLMGTAVAPGKPVLVSTAKPPSWPGSDLQQYLYCPPGYPTAATDVKLPLFAGLRRGGHLGLSSHCLDPDLPVEAVARGCKLIEMHMQLHDEPGELESGVSLTEWEFIDMVGRVRGTEVRCGL
jgi:pseudaminic acid synthase